MSGWPNPRKDHPESKTWDRPPPANGALVNAVPRGPWVKSTESALTEKAARAIRNKVGSFDGPVSLDEHCAVIATAILEAIGIDKLLAEIERLRAAAELALDYLPCVEDTTVDECPHCRLMTALDPPPIQEEP